MSSKSRLRSRMIQELESELIRLLSQSLPSDHESTPIPYHRVNFLKNLLYAEFASDPHRLSEIGCASRVLETDRTALSIEAVGPSCSCTHLCLSEDYGGQDYDHAPEEEEDRNELALIRAVEFVEGDVVEVEINRSGDHVTVDQGRGKSKPRLNRRGLVVGAALLVTVGLVAITLRRYNHVGRGDFLLTPT